MPEKIFDFAAHNGFEDDDEGEDDKAQREAGQKCQVHISNMGYGS